ncbi:MAG: diguanylate cyclase, partial [Armatimonadota bacterium]
DYLTKLYNRRYFSERLHRELDAAGREGRPVALLLADLDDLKAVNDELGHEAGDRAIIRAASVLSSNVRGTDVVARLGGDEFGILLPGASRDVAMAIADRVTQLDVQSSTPLSLTLGVAIFPEDADTAEGLLRAADQDLYKNKALRKARSALTATTELASSSNADALVLVAEDDPIALESLQELLAMAGYRTAAASDGSQVVEMVRQLRPDTVLLDVVMPGMDGTSVCREIKSDPDLRLTPVVMVTGHSSRDDKLAAIAAGADDFIRKPYDRVELLTRVKALVNTNRLNERLEDLEAVLFSLAKAVEARDPYTQGHGRRVGHYAELLGRTIGLSTEDQQALQWGAILHDIGKIGVPDAILQKPGRLTDEEMAVMRSHTEIGASICAPLKSAKTLLPIIRHHHERWDGKGYPDNLAGEAIPLVARVMAVADAFDAITTDRPYREGCPPEVAFEILREGAGTQWDPSLVEPFIAAVRLAASFTSGAAEEFAPAAVRPSVQLDQPSVL